MIFNEVTIGKIHDKPNASEIILFLELSHAGIICPIKLLFTLKNRRSTRSIVACIKTPLTVIKRKIIQVIKIIRGILINIAIKNTFHFAHV